jgi:sulfur carrier protein
VAGGESIKNICAPAGRPYNFGMNIILNGKDFDAPANITVADLIKLREIKTPAYAVERNREVVFRKDHSTTKLAENDKIEIVVAVGGG